MPTRDEIVEVLRAHSGRNLRSLAEEHGITTYETGHQNKGWKGLVLERIAGFDNNCSRAPDGGTFELKSVSFVEASPGRFVPRETMAITMINEEELRNQEFFQSHCWNKLRSMILCPVLWRGSNAVDAQLLDAVPFDFDETSPLVLAIKADYDFIRQKLIAQGFNSLTGSDGVYIQARTKGPGHGSVSRAFYARKCLVEEIVESARFGGCTSP